MKRNTKIPLPKQNSKGTPPLVSSIKNNIKKPLDEDFVAFNFRVPAEFRKRVKRYVADNDTTAVKVMMDAIEAYISE